MKSDLDRLFRDAERLRPAPELWRRISGRVRLEAGPAGWRELPYLRAAAVALAAGLLAWAAIGFLKPAGEGPVREAAAQAQGENANVDVFDPDLLGWQADLGDIDSVADEAEEVL